MSDKFDNIFKCHKITKIILNKTVELLQKDQKINKFTQNMLIGSINTMTPKILEYVINMNNEDSNQMIEQIKNIIDEK